MKKLILFFISLALSTAPVGLQAASKRVHKAAGVSSKHKFVGTQKKRIKSLTYMKSKSGRQYKVSLRNAGVNTHASSQYMHDFSASNESFYDGSGPLQLASAKALVINQLTGETLYAKNTNVATPIASVTKLMTAMVALDAHLPMDDILFIGDDDVDYIKGTHSRLTLGTALTRGELLQLALMSSENRAAAALGRNYPGGITAFVAAMNLKAAMLGMKDTRFVDSTGLDSNNVSTADDLAKMVNAAHQYPEIRQITTTASQEVLPYGRNFPINFVNTNALVRAGNWVIGLSKTGFINEAGRCLVMQAEISGQPMIIVLLDSVGKFTRIGDANRIRKWFEFNHPANTASTNTINETGVLKPSQNINV
jgi:D-alanyl-D-alanine endopeptidase (penicillin-binding protein 7)